MHREVCLYDLLQNKKTKNKKKHSSKIHRSSRPSSYDPNNIIPSRTAVFATNELLSLILSNASKEDLGTSRCVCKLWNTVARSIKIHVMSPILLHTDTAHAYPEYCETQQAMFFHPVVTASQEFWKMGSNNDVYHMNFSVNCDFISFDLRWFGCEFLTYPPIKQLALTASPADRGGEVSLLSVDEGIRLWHLAEAFRKLRRGSGVLPCRKECVGHRVSAHLIGTRLGNGGSCKIQSAVLEWLETIE